MPDSTPIVVPVHLDAICVGEEDAKNCFAPPLYDFNDLDTGDAKSGFDRADALPFTIDRLSVQRFGSANAKPAGVYLHWAMPSALTRGVAKYRITPEVVNELRHQGFPAFILDQFAPSQEKNQSATDFEPVGKFKKSVEKLIEKSGSFTDAELDWYINWVCRVASQMTFPALPDRWLVTRVRMDDPALPHRTWLIESDFVTSSNLYKDSRQYLPSATIPWPFTSEDGATLEGTKHPFRHLGRVRRLDEAWSDPAGEEVGRVSSLTAIGYGKSAFAAYLPGCQNVFGHYDCLDDVHLVDGQLASLLYTVVGWFSQPKNDPLDPRRYRKLASEPTLPPEDLYWIMHRRDWILPDVEHYSPEKRNEIEKNIRTNPVLMNIAGSFYAGALPGVQWNPKYNYVETNSLDVKVAVGSSEAEALAAYLAQSLGQTQDENDHQKMMLHEKLEALQLGILKSIQDASEPEILLEQALHTSGFHAEDGGSLWRITPRSRNDTSVSFAKQFDEELNEVKPPVQLPPEAGRALVALNRIQRVYDTLQFYNEAQRKELFFHWYYYLKWSYGIDPDEDAFKYLEQANGLLQKLEQLTTSEPLPHEIAEVLKESQKEILSKVLGEMAQVKDVEAFINQPVQNLPHMEKALGALAEEILQQAMNLIGLLEPRKNEYQLWVERAPRFFQPNEPHLLIVDEKSPPSSRFDTAAEGLLTCHRLDDRAAIALLTTADDKVGELKDQQIDVANQVLAEALAASKKDDSTPSNEVIVRRNPWHPIILEWQVKFHGFRRSTNYSENFIRDKDGSPSRTHLDLDGIDLCYNEDMSIYENGADRDTASYSGTITLSQQAMSTLQKQLAQYLDVWADDPQLNKLQELLKDQSITVLSQALNGFNDALVTLLREIQLKVSDPHATSQQQEGEIKRFRDAIGRYNTHSPNDVAAFSPIRAGYLEVEKIRLVDVFGQCRTLEKPSLILSHRLLQSDPNLVVLPPRLVQPSRLLFRWLSAADGQSVEMNSHLNTSPICGWVVSNYLDNSLMIYAQEGIFLGSIRDGGDPQKKPTWEPAAGTSILPEGFPNAEIREFVNGLLNDTDDAFRDFRRRIQQVLLLIEPQNDPYQDALAVLIGRPLALVRAMLGLELKGPPASRLDEDSYSHFLANGRLNDDNFTAVQFPVRLGDLSSGSDGLVGFFRADDDGKITYNNSTFHAEDQAEILLASYDRVVVGMLVDPRASIHATSGILPVKTIDIPIEQYAASLKRMAFTFNVYPVLSPGKLRLPLPAETDQSWVWLDPEDLQNPFTTIGKIAEWAGYREGETLRILEGWLQVNPLVAEEQHKKPSPEETP
jgi:hypothetical protein